MTPKQIASVCHEANRAITAITQDVPLQPTWWDAPEEMVRSSVKGVEWRLAHPDAPASAQHDEWMRSKLADGWTLGETKDSELKTHPALVPYEQLGPGVKAKDAVFTAIVLALAQAVPLLVLLFGLSAAAQSVLTDSSAQAAPWSLRSLFTPTNVVVALGLIASAVGGLKAFVDGRWKRRIALAAFHSFHVVEDVGNELDGEDGFDKTARFLAEVDRWFLANGWRLPKPGEKELALIEASSLHGQQVAATKVVESAVLSATIVGNVPNPKPTA